MIGMNRAQGTDSYHGNHNLGIYAVLTSVALPLITGQRQLSIT
ncbi:hypothetical protein O9993_00850 [Vibrio lentus]|nr:hypothetical protein [Vibrio lentus]